MVPGDVQLSLALPKLLTCPEHKRFLFSKGKKRKKEITKKVTRNRCIFLPFKNRLGEGVWYKHDKVFHVHRNRPEASLKKPGGKQKTLKVSREFV